MLLIKPVLQGEPNCIRQFF